MPEHPPRTLWRDEAGGRFYLVPTDLPLPEGPLELRSGSARRISVDPAAAAPHEVTREQARAFMEARLEGWAADAKRAFARLGDALNGLGGEMPGGGSRPQAATPPPAAETPPSAADAPSSPPPPESHPGVELFAALTGQRPENFLDDPEAFLRGFRQVLQGAADAVARAGQGEEGRAQFEAELQKLSDTLREHGIPAHRPGPDDSSDSPAAAPPP